MLGARLAGSVSLAVPAGHRLAFRSPGPAPQVLERRAARLREMRQHEQCRNRLFHGGAQTLAIDSDTVLTAIVGDGVPATSLQAAHPLKKSAAAAAHGDRPSRGSCTGQPTAGL